MKDGNVEDGVGGGYRLIALDIGGAGAAEDGCGRKGSLANLQTRHCPVLQPGPAGPRPDQGLHEGARPRALRPLQGSALPGLAEAVSVGKPQWFLPLAFARSVLADLIVAAAAVGTGTLPASAQDAVRPVVTG